MQSCSRCTASRHELKTVKLSKKGHKNNRLYQDWYNWLMTAKQRNRESAADIVSTGGCSKHGVMMERTPF